MITLTHKVRFKRPFHEFVQDLDEWCITHVGVRWSTWNRHIAHMDYECHTYTWCYEFLHAESAAAFALTHV